MRVPARPQGDFNVGPTSATTLVTLRLVDVAVTPIVKSFSTA